MKTSCGKFLNLAHYFPYDVKLRLLAHSRSFLANQKARNAIVGAENLLTTDSPLNDTHGVGRHIGIGQLSVIYRSTVGQVSVDTRPSIDRHSVNILLG